ncbi:hypothetical protein VSDG_06378 [Cytospora chrysosperma]|uniref:Uncharacterized protein n=1 Tax=Cytospora chrysosperma TaxID=252740 RepID=A0A423VPI9_CYTCH|nr:hypothetical protein VSDG_06378 [Valsa sordida]
MARTITFRPSSSRSSSSSSSASSCGKFVAGSPKKHYIRISAEKMRWYRAQEAAAAAAAARSGSGSGSGSGPDSPTRRLRISLKRYGSS